MWFIFLLKRIPLRAYLYMLGMVGILSGFMYIKHMGYEECQAEHTALKLKEVRAHAKLKAQIPKLSDSDLDKRLSKWMRD